MVVPTSSRLVGIFEACWLVAMFPRSALGAVNNNWEMRVGVDNWVSHSGESLRRSRHKDNKQRESPASVNEVGAFVCLQCNIATVIITRRPERLKAAICQ
jgi:hypothetical protein